MSSLSIFLLDPPAPSLFSPPVSPSTVYFLSLSSIQHCKRPCIHAERKHIQNVGRLALGGLAKSPVLMEVAPYGYCTDTLHGLPRLYLKRQHPWTSWWSPSRHGLPILNDVALKRSIYVKYESTDMVSPLLSKESPSDRWMRAKYL